jgi:hypothetical protein
MQQLLDKWERLRKSEYLRPDEKLMLNHCISDLKRFMNHSVEATEMVGNRTSVEWIEQEMLKGDLSMKQILEQAKEMDKRQIIKAYQQGVTDEHGDTITFTTEGEDYYNETYVGKK